MTEEAQIPRYDSCNYCGGEYPCLMPPAHDGQWVDYDDAKELLDAKDARIAELEKQLAEATQWRSPETAPRDGMFLALIERDRGFGRKPTYVYPMQFSTHKDGLPNERFFYGFGAYRDELPENGQGDESRFVGWLPLPQVKEETL